MAHRKPPFFYVDDRGRLTREGVHHLRNVLRRKVGDSIEISDGKGRSWKAEIVSLTTDQATIKPIEEKPPVSPPRLTLATAVPKGERMLFLVEKAAELGCGRIIPLIAQRSSVRRITAGMLRRWQARARSAGEQTRNPWLCRVEEPRPISALRESEERLCILDPAGDPHRWMSLERAAETILVVGAEGGWTPGEREAFDARGCERLALGDRTLRVETAAVVGVTLYTCIWIPDHTRP